MGNCLVYALQNRTRGKIVIVWWWFLVPHFAVQTGCNQFEHFYPAGDSFKKWSVLWYRGEPHVHIGHRKTFWKSLCEDFKGIWQGENDVGM